MEHRDAFGHSANVPEVLNNRLLRLDSHIDGELNLVNQRINWILISNSFLFTAFAVSLRTSDPGRSEVVSNFQSILVVLWKLLPCIGMMITIGVISSVFAAYSVIEWLKKRRKELEDFLHDAYGYEKISVNPGSLPHRVGSMTPVIIAFMIVLTWGYLLFIKIIPNVKP